MTGDSSAIKTPHILVSVREEGVPGRWGQVKWRGGFWPGGSDTPAAQRPSHRRCPGALSRRRRRAGAPARVPRQPPPCLTPALPLGWTEVGHKAGNRLSQGSDHKQNRGPWSRRCPSSLKEVGGERAGPPAGPARPGVRELRRGWEGDLRLGVRSAFHICPGPRRQWTHKPGRFPQETRGKPHGLQDSNINGGAEA